jgi:4-hydroxybenzoate polyprenyltransferase
MCTILDPMRKVLSLARSCHPEPTAAVTLLATVLALGTGRGWRSLWVTVAVLSGQLSVGWANDYLDRLSDAGRPHKPVAAGEVSPELVRRAAVIALAAALLLSLASGVPAALAHGLALVMAHAYNLRLKATPLSVVPYAVAFAILPLFITLGMQPSHVAPPWAMLAAACVGAGGHFTQALPDIEEDRRKGISGLPALLGPGLSVGLASLLLAAGALLALLGHGHVPGWTALASGGICLLAVVFVALAGATGRRLMAFRLTLVAAAAAVATFLIGGRPYL